MDDDKLLRSDLSGRSPSPPWPDVAGLNLPVLFDSNNPDEFAGSQYAEIIPPGDFKKVPVSADQVFSPSLHRGLYIFKVVLIPARGVGFHIAFGNIRDDSQRGNRRLNFSVR